MSFSNVIGNERVKHILGKALARNRFPNSLLFIGPEGSGKRAVALEVAKALNCERGGAEACDECPACRAIMKQEESNKKGEEKDGLFPDVMVIESPKEVVKIDQIRLLKETAYLRPMVGKKRVFIIDEADRMNPHSANSLLKIFEEPPDFVHIILLTSYPDLIPPTIQSRCQILNFSSISKKEIEKDLVGHGLEEEKARVMAQFVGGNLKKARELDWDEVQISRNKAWNLLQALLGRTSLSPQIQAFFASRDRGRARAAETFEMQSLLLRDLILFMEGGDPALLMNPDYAPQLESLAEGLHLDRALDILRRIDYALFALKKNVNVNLLVNSLFTYALE